MRRMQGIINRALFVLVIRPMTRRAIIRVRRQAEERAQAVLITPAQALLGSAIPVRLLRSEAQDAVTLADVAEDAGGRPLLRMLAVAGAAAAVATLAAVIVATIVRSRRSAEEMRVGVGTKVVAVPVTPGEQDELREIKGIGPMTAERLRGLGITSLAEIAAWTPDDVRRIAERIDYPPERIDREDWVGQAQVAANLLVAG